jgi:hypothetical protein
LSHEIQVNWEADVVRISEGNIIQSVNGRKGWLPGVEEHGMQSKVIK